MTRTQFKPQKLIDGYYSLKNKIAFAQWLLAKNKTITIGKWHAVSLGQQFFGYSANPHNSWHRIGWNGAELNQGFINVFCKTQNEATQKAFKELKLKKDGYKMLEVEDIQEDSYESLGYIISRIERLDCRVFKSTYKAEVSYSDVPNNTLLNAYFAMNDSGNISIQVTIGFEDAKDSLSFATYLPLDNENIYEFVKRVYKELEENTYPFIESDDKISMYDNAMARRRTRRDYR